MYPNGIVVPQDGRPVWVESYTRNVCRLRADGTVQHLATLPEENAIPDGLTVAADGTLVVTTLFAGGLRLLAPDGASRGSLAVGTVTSNCTFDGTTLYVTDGGSELGTQGSLAELGRLWRAELELDGAPLDGMPVFAGALG